MQDLLLCMTLALAAFSVLHAFIPTSDMSFMGVHALRANMTRTGVSQLHNDDSQYRLCGN